MKQCGECIYCEYDYSDEDNWKLGCIKTGEIVNPDDYCGLFKEE